MKINFDALITLACLAAAGLVFLRSLGAVRQHAIQERDDRHRAEAEARRAAQAAAKAEAQAQAQDEEDVIVVH